MSGDGSRGSLFDYALGWESVSIDRFDKVDHSSLAVAVVLATSGGSSAPSHAGAASHASASSQLLIVMTKRKAAPVDY